jgi:hypothetical protein
MRIRSMGMLGRSVFTSLRIRGQRHLRLSSSSLPPSSVLAPSKKSAKPLQQSICGLGATWTRTVRNPVQLVIIDNDVMQLIWWCSDDPPWSPPSRGTKPPMGTGRHSVQKSHCSGDHRLRGGRHDGFTAETCGVLAVAERGGGLHDEDEDEVEPTHVDVHHGRC